MARRRMISNAVTDAYRFQSMEPQTQLLYVYLCLKADDDGFVGNPYLFMHLTGCGEGDLETLAQRGYVILFESDGPQGGARTAAARGQVLCPRSSAGNGAEPKRNRSIVKSSPVKSSIVKSSPVKASPIKASPIKASQDKAIGFRRRITEIRTELSKEVFFLFFRMIIYFL